MHPELALSPGRVIFGDWDIDDGPAPPMTLTLTNVGTLPLSFQGTGISIVGGSFPEDFGIVGTPDAMPIAAGASREVDLTFDPSGIGFRFAILEIDTDDPSGFAAPTLLVDGSGTDQEISLSSLSVEFADADIDSAPISQLILIFNDGTGALSFTAPLAIVGADAAAFSVAGDPASTSIAVGGSRFVELRFGPQRIRGNTAILEVRTDDTDEPLTAVVLSGEGFVTTGNLAGRLTGLFGLPILPEQADVNADGLTDSADVVTNVNDGN